MTTRKAHKILAKYYPGSELETYKNRDGWMAVLNTGTGHKPWASDIISRNGAIKRLARDAINRHRPLKEFRRTEILP